jgi:hypothetical protein
MNNKDYLIHDFFDSCKSFINFFENVYLPKADVTDPSMAKSVSICSAQILYNFNLINQVMKGSIKSIFLLKKAKRESRVYDEVRQLEILPAINSKRLKHYDIECIDFIKLYKKEKENFICFFVNFNYDSLDKYAVDHNIIGTVTLKELIYYIISTNYGVVEQYKNAIQKKYEII